MYQTLSVFLKGNSSQKEDLNSKRSFKPEFFLKQTAFKRRIAYWDELPWGKLCFEIPWSLSI